ncbi:hypothetical protein HU200_059439 [Digitaria exilis]|uniref:F-box domain-containing protein n=1 Tax=Digitaria exilis TaxID=1010633 RepID=A0A835AB02_9POAL|nr:hypothetical protein HU200_059439 [Digitaria exilis]
MAADGGDDRRQHTPAVTTTWPTRPSFAALAHGPVVSCFHFPCWPPPPLYAATRVPLLLPGRRTLLPPPLPLRTPYSPGRRRAAHLPQPPSRRRGPLPRKLSRRCEQASLPLDLLLEIAARSDAVTLVRCAATCRELRRHIAGADLRGRLRLRCPDRFVTSPARPPAVNLVDNATPDATTTLLNAAACFPSTSVKSCKALAARDGLILLQAMGIRRPCVYCPATGYTQALPPGPWPNGHHVLLVAAGGEGGLAGRPFQVLNVTLRHDGHYLQIQKFSLEKGTWVPCQGIAFPRTKYGNEMLLSEPLVIGDVVRWLCHYRWTKRYFVVRLNVSADGDKISLTELPKGFHRACTSFNGGISHMVLAKAAAGSRRPIVLSASDDHDDVISVWAQSKRTGEWKKRPDFIVDCEAMKGICTLGSVRFVWFAERSGIVLLAMRHPAHAAHAPYPLEASTKPKSVAELRRIKATMAGAAILRPRKRPRRRNHAASIPLDLVLEIAARSDPATLLRCAAACRELRRHISDPIFFHGRLRLRRHADQFVPSLLRGGLVDRRDRNLILAVPAAAIFPPAQDHRGTVWDVHPAAARDGLILVHGNFDKLCVYCPVTGRTQHLPRGPTDHGQYVLLVGDGDGDGRPFQVIKACFVKSSYGCRSLQIHTFSSEQGTWSCRIRSSSLLIMHGDEELHRPENSVVIGDTVHWLYHLDRTYYVLKAHLRAARVTFTELPKSFHVACRSLRDAREQILLVTSPPLGRSPMVLVANNGMISAWAQSERTGKWSKQPHFIVKDCGAAMKAGDDLIGSMRLDWFAERSGIVLYVLLA